MTHLSKLFWNDELYSCIKLTENEHYIVKDLIDSKCAEFGLFLEYYRELKDGHWPMYREFKVTGNSIDKFVNWLNKEGLTGHLEKNPWT